MAEEEESCSSSDHTDTASRCAMRVVKGVHRFTLERYSLSKGVGWNKPIHGGRFSVGGHLWNISVYPDGSACILNGKIPTRDDTGDSDLVRLGLYLSLVTHGHGVRCFYTMTLLDQSGAGNHILRRPLDGNFNPETKPVLFTTNVEQGFPWVIKQCDLHDSPYLMYDCLKIECALSVVLPSETISVDVRRSIRGCDDDEEFGTQLLTLLETGEASDVVFDVCGERFRAHRAILASRSSVFASMFSDERQDVVTVAGIEPRVFKVLLHFLYSDTLPEHKYFATGYAFGPTVSSTLSAQLLAAAVEYGLRNLKAICETHIWKSISLGRFSETLILADKYSASELKRLCFEYAADNVADLMELDVFKCLRKSYALLYRELDDYLSIEETRFASVGDWTSCGKDGRFGLLLDKDVDSSGRRIRHKFSQ